MTEINSGADLMAVVRDAMHTESVRSLARDAGVSPSALYAIRRGKTRWPRDYTLFALTTLTGIRIHVTRRKP